MGMHPTPSPARRRSSRRVRPVLAVLGVLLSGVGLVACGGDDSTALATKESNRRAQTAEPEGGTDPDSEYCTAVTALQGPGAADLDDPAASIEALAALGEVAPAELRSSFEVLSDVVEELSTLDPDDPEYITRALELIMDPSVQEAADHIDDVTAEMCGLDLSELDEPGTTNDTIPDDTLPNDTLPNDTLPNDTLPDVSIPEPGAAAGDIDLEHIDRIKDEHQGSSWVEKLSTTSIMNDTAVSLSADASDPITPAEAMEACQVVRSALVSINPDVTVSITNGETAVVQAPAGGACAPA